MFKFLLISTALSCVQLQTAVAPTRPPVQFKLSRDTPPWRQLKTQPILVVGNLPEDFRRLRRCRADAYKFSKLRNQTPKQTELEAKPFLKYCQQSSSSVTEAEDTNAYAECEPNVIEPAITDNQLLPDTDSQTASELIANDPVQELGKRRRLPTPLFCFNSDDSVEEDDHDPDYLPKTPPAKSPKSRKYNTLDLSRVTPTIAAEGYSNKGSARFMTATYKAIDQDITVTEKKIRGMRHRARKECLARLDGMEIQTIYFDGRDDKTTLIKDDKNTVRRESESHVTVMSADNITGDVQYLGFTCPINGTGRETEDAIISHLEEIGVDYEPLLLAGCDNCIVNTGRIKGAITLLEHRLKRPLQWSICSLHRIELPFRQLFHAMDGTTSGPNSFTGPIGKAAQDDKIRKLPLRKYQKLDCAAVDLPGSVIKKLSWDQKVLCRLVVAVQTGEFPADLECLTIGHLNHARWLTFQSRVLRLYCSRTLLNCDHLKRLATYIVGVYFPLHMEIKYQDTITDGPAHLFHEIRLIKLNFEGEDRKTCLDNLSNLNCHWAHPENVLIAMLADGQFDTRLRAVCILNDIRAGDSTGSTVRSFYLPKLNTDATHYSKLCSMYETVDGAWVFKNKSDKEILVTEPPILDGVDVSRFLMAPFTSAAPCHTQALERFVAVTTAVSKLVCGKNMQCGEALLKIRGRSER